MKNPELYNATPYNFNTQNTQITNLKSLPFKENFLESIAEDYYETCKEAKIITFDSGEHSLRRNYVTKTLSYLLQVKGIPSVAISTLNEKYTNYYLTRIPQILRNRILDLGIFHVYNNIVKLQRRILELLYPDVRYHSTIDYYMYATKSLESKLIKQLTKLGLLVVLDRSLISVLIYNHAIFNPKKTNYSCHSNTNLLYLETLKYFKPYASFFIHSPTTKDPTKKIEIGTFYDSFDEINLNIRTVLPTIKEHLPILTEIHEYESFEENMKHIRENLKDL